MNTRKKAIIFGITGQDGRYLAAYLLDIGYEVIGVPRRSSIDSHTERLNNLLDDPKLTLMEGDVSDASSVTSIIRKTQPDEIYNLAAQSHVHTSFEQPLYTFSVNTGGVLNILEAVRHFAPWAKVYQASTSEMFGNNVTVREHCGGICGDYVEKYQCESTAFDPASPYAVSKVAAHQLCGLYRSSYNLFVSCGILFNHESPFRGKNFVTRKITRHVAKLKNALNHNTVPKLKLGNLDACRDWGYAGDYVRAMHMMLQANDPDDYVVATGQTHSVRDFCEAAFAAAGFKKWEHFVETDPQFVRPKDVEYLRGNAYKIHSKLGWEPQVSFKDLVSMMVESDIENGS